MPSTWTFLTPEARRAAHCSILGLAAPMGRRPDGQSGCCVAGGERHPDLPSFARDIWLVPRRERAHRRPRRAAGEVQFLSRCQPDRYTGDRAATPMCT
jgi:hypothetical protein